MTEDEYKLSFRIRRIHLGAIKDGSKPAEIRGSCDFWDIRAQHALEMLKKGKKVTAVLVCGRDKLALPVVRITRHEDFERDFGFKLSSQAIVDIGTGPVWLFWFR